MSYFSLFRIIFLLQINYVNKFLHLVLKVFLKWKIKLQMLFVKGYYL